MRDTHALAEKMAQGTSLTRRQECGPPMSASALLHARCLGSQGAVHQPRAAWRSDVCLKLRLHWIRSGDKGMDLDKPQKS